MTERKIGQDFEESVRLAVASYASEGVVAFDPGRIAAHARAADVPWWGRPSRVTTGLGLRAARFALLVLLLGAAMVVFAVAGSRPPTSLRGLLVVGSTDTIFVVDPSTGTSRAITAQTPHDDYPVWSPDGMRLVLSQHDGRGRLQLIDADGGNRHAVVDDLTSPDLAAWSPDGARIAFYGYHYPGVAGRGLYVVNADGTGLTLLVPGAGGGWTSRLAWSPDGSMIAFATGDDARPIDDARGYVYVVDVATAEVTAVSSSDVDTYSGGPLAWRPGGTELLYAQQGRRLYSQRDPQSGDAVHEDIVLATRVGGTWRERQLIADLMPSAFTDPLWLDAERFAYMRDGRLWVAGLDGRPEVPISEPGLVADGPWCVAPDGSAVVIRSGDVDDVPDTLLLVPTDGSASVPAFTGFFNHLPACSWQAVDR